MKRSTCAIWFRSIWWADVYGKWLHRKVGSYRANRYFGGGQHEAILHQPESAK